LIAFVFGLSGLINSADDISKGEIPVHLSLSLFIFLR
jgi:hypothetical protein